MFRFWKTSQSNPIYVRTCFTVFYLLQQLARIDFFFFFSNYYRLLRTVRNPKTINNICTVTFPRKPKVIEELECPPWERGRVSQGLAWSTNSRFFFFLRVLLLFITKQILFSFEKKQKKLRLYRCFDNTFVVCRILIYVVQRLRFFKFLFKTHICVNICRKLGVKK